MVRPAGLTPLFPFGYGLSYSRFTYTHLQVARASDGGLDVTFRLTNPTGRGGDEVAQVYLGAPATPPANAQFAIRALAGYARVPMPAHSSRRLTIHVNPRRLQYWSTTQGWTTATGTRTVYLGASSRDLRAQANINITP